MSWVLTIHEVPPSGNVLKRMHWARYSKLLETWWYLVRAAEGFEEIPTATGPRRLTITRHGVRPLDRDNLYASMKPAIDVLRPAKHEEGWYKSGARAGQYWSRRRIGHGLIVDDDAAHLALEVRQEPLPKGARPYLTMLLEPLHPGESTP